MSTETSGNYAYNDQSGGVFYYYQSLLNAVSQSRQPLRDKRLELVRQCARQALNHFLDDGGTLLDFYGYDFVRPEEVIDKIDDTSLAEESLPGLFAVNVLVLRAMQTEILKGKTFEYSEQSKFDCCSVLQSMDAEKFLVAYIIEHGGYRPPLMQLADTGFLEIDYGCNADEARKFVRFYHRVAPEMFPDGIKAVLEEIHEIESTEISVLSADDIDAILASQNEDGGECAPEDNPDDLVDPEPDGPEPDRFDFN